jgi:hypothetical protein
VTTACRALRGGTVTPTDYRGPRIFDFREFER